MTRTASSGRRPHRILLAEHDHELQALWSFVLVRAGYEVTSCASAGEFRVRIEKFEPAEFDLIVCDIRLLQAEIVAALIRRQKQKECPPLVVIVVLGQQTGRSSSYGLSIAAVLDQPFDIKNQLSVVRSLVPMV